MKNFLYLSLIFLLSLGSGLYSFKYLTGINQMLGIFFAGLLAGIFLMTLRLNVKNNILNSSERELEKKSVTALESNDKVRILESKIEVLEKALNQ